MSVVGFCGSRGVAVPGLVSSVVAGALGRGSSVAVGCCVGADASVVSAVVGAGASSRLRVFSAFGLGGRGSVSVSAVGAVVSAFSSGALVSWWAGGRGSVSSRLRGRSLSLVRFLASSGGSLVCFLGSVSSRGSLLAVRAAVRAGVPVFVWVCGSFSVPPSVGSGRWVRACSRLGFVCWRWASC